MTVRQNNESHFMWVDRYCFKGASEGHTLIRLTRVDSYDTVALQDVALVEPEREVNDIEIHFGFSPSDPIQSEPNSN